jgi:hypothetical protein
MSRGERTTQALPGGRPPGIGILEKNLKETPCRLRELRAE